MSRCTRPASRSCSTAPASPAPTARATTASGTSRCCRSCPHIRIAAPRDAERLREELREAVAVDDAPTVIRFPKGSVGADLPARPSALDDGVDVLVRVRRARTCCIVRHRPDGRTSAVRRRRAARAPRASARPSSTRAGSCRCSRRIVELAASHRLVISIEDGIRVGGIGTRVRQVLREAGVDTAVDELGLPDEFLDHAIARADPRGCRAHARSKIAHDVVAQVLGTTHPASRAAPAETDADDTRPQPRV